MRIKMWAFLLDKTVIIDGKPREVYGLSDFHCRPSRRGIGTHCLMVFEEIAKQDGKYCLVGFCDKETVKFYLKAGWYWIDSWKDENIVSNIKIKSIISKEAW